MSYTEKFGVQDASSAHLPFPEDVVIIDVREDDEYEAERIERSVHIPLSRFGTVAPGVLMSLKQGELLFMCRSGTRAQLAIEEFKKTGYEDKFTISAYEGGISNWAMQGKPIIKGKVGAKLPLMRQVQIAAGSLVLLGCGLSLTTHSYAIYLSIFVGAGLVFAGVSGFCGMAVLLAKMPWNQ